MISHFGKLLFSYLQLGNCYLFQIHTVLCKYSVFISLLNLWFQCQLWNYVGTFGVFVLFDLFDIYALCICSYWFLCCMTQFDKFIVDAQLIFMQKQFDHCLLFLNKEKTHEIFSTFILWIYVQNLKNIFLFTYVVINVQDFCVHLLVFNNIDEVICTCSTECSFDWLDVSQSTANGRFWCLPELLVQSTQFVVVDRFTATMIEEWTLCFHLNEKKNQRRKS